MLALLSGLLFMERPIRVGVRIPVAAEAGVFSQGGSSLAIEALRTVYYPPAVPRRAFGLPAASGPISGAIGTAAICLWPAQSG